MNTAKSAALERVACSIALLVLTPAAPAMAGTLSLTAAGTGFGFTLTVFATLNPGATGPGPFGIAVAANGSILVSNSPDATRYVFADMDGQTKSSALTHVPSSSGAFGYATARGLPYGGEGGHFVQFNNNGTVNHVLTGVAQAPFLGMWANPSNGHIVATSSGGLIDIDPLANGGAGSSRVINALGNGDGVSVSPDGRIAYVEQGQINGYDIATGAQVFSSGFLFNGPDGTGTIASSNGLNGRIIVHTNSGVVDLLDPATKTSVTIAAGGTRGDYVSPDRKNGTLFRAYSDVVYRLSCGADCRIGGGSGGAEAPEPATVLLFGPALAALGAILRRKEA